MNSDRVVVQGEGLGKLYRRGSDDETGLLRDRLAKFARAPLSVFKKVSVETFWALKDVSLEIKEGEVLGLVGRNGAGKTTLLKILSRITRPTTGYAEIRGRIGSLLEVGTGFHPELSGRENTYLSGAILGMGKREIDRKFDEIVAFAELEKFIDTQVKHYSSGMYVRLAFAVAAHLEPEILLVDEVLAVGDIKFQRKCLGKMGDVARAGRTVVLVSHQLNQIRRLCQRVLWVDDGQIRRNGPAHEVVSAYESAMSSPERTGGTVEGSRAGKAKFISWRIVASADSEAHRLESVGPVEIAFQLRVDDRISGGHQEVALFDSERRLMWAYSNDDLNLNPGTHELVFKFPFLPLCPKSYNWQLSLWDETGDVDLWEALPELLVTAPNYQHPLDEWNGFLNVPSSIRVLSEKG
jgi:lipopolysaccharide transport system ATP-binding protein